MERKRINKERKEKGGGTLKDTNSGNVIKFSASAIHKPLPDGRCRLRPFLGCRALIGGGGRRRPVTARGKVAWDTHPCVNA